MNKLKGVVLGGALLGAASFGTAAVAQVTSSAGYLYADTSEVNLDALYASLGYEFDFGQGLSLTPEGRIGFGLSSSTLFPGVDAKINRFYGPAVRLTFTFDNDFYVFGTASYLRYELKASGAGVSLTDESWEGGGGAGAGFYFTPTLGAEFLYERVDDANVFAGALRFRF